jgi:hypothetical protein
MNAVYAYLIASTWFFLLGWVVLLLVAYALAFRGDSAYGLVWTRATTPASIQLTSKASGEVAGVHSRGGPYKAGRKRRTGVSAPHILG